MRISPALWLCLSERPTLINAKSLGNAGRVQDSGLRTETCPLHPHPHIKLLLCWPPSQCHLPIKAMLWPPILLHLPAQAPAFNLSSDTDRYRVPLICCNVNDYEILDKAVHCELPYGTPIAF